MIARALVVTASLAMNVTTLILGCQARDRIASRIETAELVVAGQSTGPRAVATAAREGATLEFRDWLRQPSLRLEYRAPSIRGDVVAAKRTHVAFVVEQFSGTRLSVRSGESAVSLGAGGGASVSADVPQATTWIVASDLRTKLQATDSRPGGTLNASLGASEDYSDLILGDARELGVHVTLSESYATWQMAASSEPSGTSGTRNRVESRVDNDGSSLGFVDERFGDRSYPINLGAHPGGHVLLFSGVRGSFSLDATHPTPHDTSGKGTR